MSLPKKTMQFSSLKGFLVDVSNLICLLATSTAALPKPSTKKPSLILPSRTSLPNRYPRITRIERIPDGMRGVPAICPSDRDPLSYSTGYIEGKAQRAKGPIRAVETKPDTDRRRP
jgi:hypothetical protein